MKCAYWYSTTDKSWHRADAGHETVHALHRGGYVALHGDDSIGPPDDGPDDYEIERMLRDSGYRLSTGAPMTKASDWRARMLS